MPVTIRKMTDEEFAFFCQWSVEHHAKELMEERGVPWGKAVHDGKEEMAQMLPEGVYTQDNFLMTVTVGEENVGVIWTLHEVFEGRKQSFLCDFAIWEAYRRKGYGQEALRLAEERAAEAGCEECVLFVADRNEAAKALYHKCGYRFLRQESYGEYMVKRLL